MKGKDYPIRFLEQPLTYLPILFFILAMQPTPKYNFKKNVKKLLFFSYQKLLFYHLPLNVG